MARTANKAANGAINKKAESKVVKRTKVSKNAVPLEKKISRTLGISIGSAKEAIANKNEKRVLRGEWPADELFFKTFPEDSAYEYLYTILEERGWKFAGEPYKGDDMNALERVIKKAQPKRCLWLVDEQEAQILSKIPADSIQGGRHKIGCILGAESANYKTNITKRLNDKPYYPKSYYLPAEQDRFEASIAKEEQPLWIYKPKNDYGGSGCHVYKIHDKEFRRKMTKMIQSRRHFILQRYIENPLLLGEYKFHLRVFLVITSLQPLCGYLHTGGQVLFSTHKYRRDEDSLGENFDKHAHLTNWSIHHREENYKALIEDKPVVGIGCEWRWRRFISYMKNRFPNFKPEKLTSQLTRISRDVMHAIAAHDNVKRNMKKMVPGRHFEVFGLDVMIDEQLKCWLLESNNSPGLNRSPEKVRVPGSKKTKLNPGARGATKDTHFILHDLFTLLNIDNYNKKGSKKNWIKL